MSGEFLLIPFAALALALIIFGVPYCFIREIKDLRVRWAIGGAYFGFLLSLLVIVDLNHFEQLWTEFSARRLLTLIAFVSIGILVGWTWGAFKQSIEPKIP